MDKKDCLAVITNIELLESKSTTYVVMLVVHNDFDKNKPSRIHCKNLIPLKGYSTDAKVIPLGGYVYDARSDFYIVNCLDFYPIGKIPFSLKIKVKNCGNWMSNIPIPSEIIRSHIDKEKLSSLDSFIDSFKHERNLHFQYIQFIDAF